MSQIQRFFTVLFFASLLAIAGCSKSDSTSGIENTNDLDKDGIIDIQDPDIDGDGIPNEKDPDMDGDGIPNEKDPDANGDGLDDFGPPGLPGQCPSSADGTYPNCTCPTGSVYLPQANDCAAEAGWNPIVAGCYSDNSNIKRLVNSYIAGDKEVLRVCGPIGSWDVSRVTDMAGLFQNTSFNENINHWQVGQVTNFGSMFAGAEQFNQPLNKWSIKTTSLFGMFKGAKSFNQDIRGWNPPNEVPAAYGFLLNGTAFTYDLSVWCLDQVAAANEFSLDSPIAGQPDKQPRWLGSSCKAELPDVVQCSDLNGVEGGEWPNCTCEQGYEFNSTTNSCETVTPEPLPDECPEDEKLINGKCVNEFFYGIPGCQYSGPVLAHQPQGPNTAKQSDTLCEIEGWRLPSQDEMQCIWAAREVFGGAWKTSNRYWTSSTETVNDVEKRIAVRASDGHPIASSPYEGFWRTCVLD